MLLSVADARPRNLEVVRVQDLVPSSLQTNASTFIRLVSEYYKFLNQDGLPTRELSSIRTLKDIDLVSERYLDKIAELIGKSIPQSKVINKVDLYKFIVSYYNTRGSDDSVHAFFKIFFNELVTIFYPKEFLFSTSGGEGNWETTPLFTGISTEVLVREVADVVSKTITGITFSAKENDGNGNLLSVRFFPAVENQYEVQVDYFKGVTSVKPGNKSRLEITADPLLVGEAPELVTYPIAASLYFSGFGEDNRPKFSEQLNAVEIPFTGSPSRIEWNGEKWIFTIGSESGDVFAFYSDEDVLDPTLVTTWNMGWFSAIGEPIAGGITNIEFAPALNSQLFSALAETTEFNNDFLINADVLDENWTSVYSISARNYLTSNPLPTSGISAGTYAVVNGRKSRPFVVGKSAIINDEFVWHKDFVEKWVYRNHKSFASDMYKLYDGYYWQDYSYVIRTNLDAEDWLNAYRQFIHPAGMQLFSAIAIEMLARSEWNEPLDYSSSDLDNDFAWLKALMPSTSGFHSPKYQPGYLRDKLLRYLYSYLFSNQDEELLRIVITKMRRMFGVGIEVQSPFVYSQFSSEDKFRNPQMLNAGLLELTIADAESEYSIQNTRRANNISVFVELA